MKIYTRTGDTGETGLYGGSRVSKSDLRVSAYGTVDEANCLLGVARSELADSEVSGVLDQIQNTLFELGADLATPLDARQRDQISQITDADATALEELIDRYEEELEPLRSFILPGGSPPAAMLHLARATVRRAERDTVLLKATEPVNPATITYLNRLSDLLFVLARLTNMRSGVSEVRWRSRAA